MHAAFLAHLIFLDFITPNTFREGYIQFMTFLSVKLSLVSYYILYHKYKYSLQHCSQLDLTSNPFLVAIHHLHILFHKCNL